jgi:hypothetical protein
MRVAAVAAAAARAEIALTCPRVLTAQIFHLGSLSERRFMASDIATFGGRNMHAIVNKAHSLHLLTQQCCFLFV